jgi:hypothetical protein
MTIEDVIATMDFWELTHLIKLGPTDWQANICDGEHVAVGTGRTMTEAVVAAHEKAESGIFVGRLYHLGPIERHSLDLPDLLRNLLPPKPTINRRI